jgi:hypothetical protein
VNSIKRTHFHLPKTFVIQLQYQYTINIIVKGM